MINFMTVAVAVAIGALSQGLTFGTYDYFKSKGYSGWMAGALMGGVISGVSTAMLMAFQGTATEAQAMAGCLSGGCRGLGGITLTQIPKSLGYLTAAQLNGVTVQQLNGITMDPLSGPPRSAQRRQIAPTPSAVKRRYANAGSGRFRVVA